MDREQMISMFLMTNSKYFAATAMPMVRTKLEGLSDSGLQMALGLEYKDPTLMLIISLFFGTIGVDRFLIGDIGMGILKLFTLGLCGFLALADWFMIMGRTRQKNLDTLLNIF